MGENSKNKGIKENFVKKDNLLLERIGENDIEAIKFVYLCNINDDEKEKSTYLAIGANNQRTEYEEEKFQKFLPKFQEILKKSSVHYVLKENDSFIGFLQVNNYNPRNQSVEIGFYFPKENRRKGYGKILIELFLKTVFSENYFWKINKIYGETCETNIGSKKLFEAFGFHLDGKMREHYWFGEQKYAQLVYSLLKSEYLA
jgi:RimJ/RimL family protein N-acetyltransferase